MANQTLILDEWFEKIWEIVEEKRGTTFHAPGAKEALKTSIPMRFLYESGAAPEFVASFIINVIDDPSASVDANLTKVKEEFPDLTLEMKASGVEYLFDKFMAEKRKKYTNGIIPIPSFFNGPLAASVLRELENEDEQKA